MAVTGGARTFRRVDQQARTRLAGLARTTGVAGGALLGLGVVLAAVLHASDGAVLALPVLLVLAGLVALVVSLGLVHHVETDPSDLDVPDEHAAAVRAAGGVPGPSWWAPLAGAGALVAVAGLLVSPALWGLGVGVALSAGAVGVVETWYVLRASRWRQADDAAPVDREAVRTARRIRAFGRQRAVDDDAAVACVVEHLGRYGAKVVMVGADGRYGDLVLPDVARAELAVRLAGTEPLAEFDRDLGARMVQGTPEWSLQGGGSAVPPAGVVERTA